MENHAMFGTFDPKDPKSTDQNRRLAMPMLDAQIKSVVNMIWMALPPERQTAAEFAGRVSPAGFG